MLWSVDERRHPRAGVDFPGTWQAFEAWFPDDEACREFLVRVRWRDGFVCSGCGGGDAGLTGRGLWMCRQCGRQSSVTAGTIFHRSRYPLRMWFAAMWFVCSQKNGVSARGLQRVLGFGSYETAWAWLHKLRRAMVRPDRDLLGGEGVSVEVDQTFLGGIAPGRSRLAPRYANKAEVVIAVERQHPKGLGRARLAHIATAERKADIHEFIRHNIAHGTILYTDGEASYTAAAKALQFRHEPVAVTRSSRRPHDLLPAVHRVSALLKRWITGTLHDRVSDQHLAYYLDEFTFRFNRRTSRSSGLLWYRLVQQALDTEPHPLATLHHKA